MTWAVALTARNEALEKKAQITKGTKIQCYSVSICLSAHCRVRSQGLIKHSTNVTTFTLRSKNKTSKRVLFREINVVTAKLQNNGLIFKGVVCSKTSADPSDISILFER